MLLMRTYASNVGTCAEVCPVEAPKKDGEN